MMPKGVEHIVEPGHYPLRLKLVRIPMMPKGVEHTIEIEQAKKIISENSHDAERR